MKKTLCIILCLITLNSLSGCGNKKEYATGGESLTAIEFKEQEQSPKIKISAVECDSFIRAYADINAEQYPYSELFGISAAMNKMQESRNLTGEHQYSFFKADKTVRADKLLEVVKKNNAEYRKDTVKKNMTKEFSDMCPPSKNGHKKASKNEMNRSISLIYENRPHLFHGLLAGDLCRHDEPAKERSSPRAIRPGTSLSYRLLIVKQLSRHKC